MDKKSDSEAYERHLEKIKAEGGEQRRKIEELKAEQEWLAEQRQTQPDHQTSIQLATEAAWQRTAARQSPTQIKPRSTQREARDTQKNSSFKNGGGQFEKLIFSLFIIALCLTFIWWCRWDTKQQEAKAAAQQEAARQVEAKQIAEKEAQRKTLVEEEMRKYAPAIQTQEPSTTPSTEKTEARPATLASYRTYIKAVMEKQGRLLNPEGAQYRFGEPYRYTQTFANKQIIGYRVDFEVNAKNAFNAYGGWYRWWAFFTLDGGVGVFER